MKKIELTGRIAAALATLIAAWLLGRFADASAATELGHGALTGIFVKIALASAFALAIATALILKRSKHGFSLTAAGILLALPLLSWLLFPGIWCSIATCSMQAPAFSADHTALKIGALLAASFLLQWKVVKR